MYFVGDTHSIKPIFQIIDKHKLESQNLIHAGDLGLGFQEIKRDIHDLEILDEALNETNNILYAIRGNHDNPIFFNKSYGLRLPKFHNIHLLDDYDIRYIEDKTLMFAGGATSIDRIIRESEYPPTWWVNERFFLDTDKLSKIEKDIKNIDIVITHTAPSYAFPQMGMKSQIVNHYCALDPLLRITLENERKQMDNLHEFLMKKYKPSHWIYGHFHNTKKQIISGTEFKLLNINELYEIK